MKKIVLSANTSWYLYNFRQSTITAFKNLGFDVVCLSPEDKYSELLITELGCQWYDIKMDNKGSNPFKDALVIYTFVKLYYKIMPLIVFNFTIKNNIYGTWAARLCKIKVVNNVSGLGTAFITVNLTSKIVKLLYRLSQPFASRVFCQNPEDMSLLIENKLVQCDKLILLPGSGVNINRFLPDIKRSRDINTPFRFLYVGRMLGDKGILELVSAAHKMAEAGYSFTLGLCGFADARNATALTGAELDRLAQAHYIHLLGSSDSIEAVYANSDCVVLPSYREGMPRTLLEAGAMGLPSVTTNVPGCKHVITHGFNGLLCDVKSVESLCEQLIAMIEMDKETYTSMCINSRARIVNDYDEQIVVQHALDAVEDLVGNKKTKV
ncbi:glycosyltransferase [Vibrio sp. 10N.286.49.C2]|uniref:glycosyltransferase family 4 protein n=1 Tax=unclassified Vibrio TaxID=2614977 RepID=UPI000C82696F|nr:MULTISPECIES: glycosyltransferase family 4 protein [unclassified Vibrio]PMH32142.1 glycosyltransferase [Vibrio sp. 10N.286.49.C2]PMH47963.1 glycosyltransferase [Vibrio sp. 10N.286.49.B1]